MRKKIFFVVFALFIGCYAYAEETDNLYVSSRVIEKKWTNFNLSDVRLLEGSCFKHMQDLHLDYLLSLDPERLLNNVLRGGDIPTSAENYGGWQHDSGNGFSNYMAGCAMLYASTGDERLLERVKWMIDQISFCQEKENLDGFFYFGRSKGAASYNVLMAATEDGVFPNNNGEDFYTNSAMAGMAFYQLHRIFYGIRDAYYYTQYEKAKNVFIKCMEWACKWTDLISNDERFQIALEAEHGGMTELFVDAYALTGNRRFLDNAKRWTHSLNFRDPMAKGIDVLTSRHANVYDPKYMGLIRDYEFTGNEQNRDAALNIWDMVVEHHVLPMGGHGRWERYGEPGKLLDLLANTSAETCCTNNMLRFSKAMFSVFGDTKYLDFYEKALYNHILASKDPDNRSVGGGFCYYQSLMPGQCRKYMDDNSFYCCWETGLENHSKYGEAIYFHNDNDILVNLYIPSTVNYTEKEFSMKMETEYPTKDEVTLTVMEVGKFSGDILFRCPKWMEAGKVKVVVNEEKITVSCDAGALVSIKRQWKAGDVITLKLPSNLRYEESEEPNVCALFYGPLLLAADLGAASGQYISNVWDQNADTQLELCPDFPNLIGAKADLTSWLTKTDENNLRFKAMGADKEYEFMPYYKAYHRKTSIYQRFVHPMDVEWERQYVTDRVLINVNEQEHQYSGRGTVTATAANRYYRRANVKNTISYVMKTSLTNDVQHWIGVKYDGWEKEDVGHYDVYVDDVKIGSENTCERTQQFTFPTKFFKIPKKLTNGKTNVKLQIRLNDKPMNFYGFMMVTDDYFKKWYPPTKRLSDGEDCYPRLEAENAQPHGDNRVFDGSCSGGCHVERLTSYLQYKNLFVERAGYYKLSICYRAGKETKQKITVNEVETEVTLPQTNNEWKVFDTSVNLKNGFNVLRFNPSSARYFVDVDYFELKFEKESSLVNVGFDDGYRVYTDFDAGRLSFEVIDLSWSGEIRINDVKGKVLWTGDYPENRSLFINTFPPGVYVVSFWGNRGDVNAIKVLI